MEMDSNKFLEWKDSASQEDLRLIERLYDLGDYFLDMLFEPGSTVDSLIRCQSMTDGGEWKDDAVARPDILEYFCYNYFRTKVEPLKGCGGYFDKKEQLLCISTENLKDDSVILHEMIHLHEAVLEDVPLFYHDTLLWALYINLKSKIGNLDEIVLGYAHILNEQSICNQGGLHDILFLLKSLDLDIRMGYQLGTTFGYDMKNELKDYTYRSES